MVWAPRNGGQKFSENFHQKALVFPVPPKNHDFSDFPAGRKMTLHVWMHNSVKIGQKPRKKIPKSIEYFRNFRGGFTRIRLQATENDFLENR